MNKLRTSDSTLPVNQWKTGFQIDRAHILRFLLLMIGGFGSFACEEVPCTSKPETTIGIEFCDASTSGIVPKNYFIRQILVRNNRAFMDTISKSASSFRIRFPSNADFFWLTFQDTTSRDSLRFSYSRSLEFAGESCGFYYGFKDLQVDSTSGVNFDRAQIITNQGDSSNKVHVRIFW